MIFYFKPTRSVRTKFKETPCLFPCWDDHFSIVQDPKYRNTYFCLCICMDQSRNRMFLLHGQAWSVPWSSHGHKTTSKNGKINLYQDPIMKLFKELFLTNLSLSIVLLRGSLKRRFAKVGLPPQLSPLASLSYTNCFEKWRPRPIYKPLNNASSQSLLSSAKLCGSTCPLFSPPQCILRLPEFDALATTVRPA